MRKSIRRFRPVLECLEDRLTPSNLTATVTGTTFTITKTTPGGSGSALDITPVAAAATFGALTVTSTGGDMINGSASPFTTPKPVTTVVVNLGLSGTIGNSAEDTLTFDGSTGTGPINLTGGLSIAGTGGDKILALTDVNLLHSSALKVNLTGNGAETSTFTNVNVGGAATITHPGAGNTTFTITNNSAIPGSSVVYNWGSLSITNGQGADVNTINDTNFTGSVTINNGPGDGTTGVNGGSKNIISALNDQTLATIGGSVTINTTSGMSDSELFDYNVNGNVTIKSSPAEQDFVGLENNPTIPGSGIPVIGGNVTITAGTGSTRLDATATIDFGTGGKDPYTYGKKATNNPLFIEGSLAITVTGDGMAIDLNDLSVANGTTSVALGTGDGDTVAVQGSSSVTSVFDNFNITASGTGGNTLSIQDQAGTIEFGGAVNVQLTGGGNTLNLAADTNNSIGVAGAVVDLFSTTVFKGGTGTTSSEFEGTANTDLFFATAPLFSHFH